MCCLGNYIVQYGLVDSDIEVHCLINGYDRSYTIFTWTYKKEKKITSKIYIHLSLLCLYLGI